MDILVVEIWGFGIAMTALAVLGFASWNQSKRSSEVTWKSVGYPVGCFAALFALATPIIGPEFICARSVTQKTTCIHNLKQLSTGLQLYAQANNDRFPVNGGLSTVAGYVEDPRAYRCPAASSPGGYAMNKHVVGINSNWVDNPKSLVVAFESDAPNGWSIGDARDFPREPRHGGTDHIAFLDCSVGHHVRSATSSRTSSPTDWVPTLSPPEPSAQP